MDVILTIAAIAIVDDKILVEDSFEIAIPQYRFLHDNGITNEFITESSLPKLSEPEAIKALLQYIKNATLIGHRINFDIEMINEALDKLECGKIKNEALDIEVMYKKLLDSNDKDYSLNELASLLKVPFNDRISASDDAYIIAILFLKLKTKLHLEM
jgi:DNA polymerase-3 subunit epsilon